MAETYDQDYRSGPESQGDFSVASMDENECVHGGDSGCMGTTGTTSQAEITGHDGSGGRPCLERARYLRDIVRVRNASGKSVWCNRKSHAWFDEVSATWKALPEPTSDCDGGTPQQNLRNTKISLPKISPQDIPPINFERIQKRSTPLHKKGLFWSVRDTFVNRFQRRQNVMLKINISHLGTFGQEDTNCYTTHFVPTYKLVGHLFILHAMEGGVAPRSNIALVQNGALNDRGEWVVFDTKAKPYYWNPIDETSVMNAGWYFCGNELWLALIST